jgi:peptidoglycan hydrolase CwlO-like protein
MDSLMELIKVSQSLCMSLESYANNDKKYCDEVCYELEKYSNEVHKMTNNIKELKNVYGG